MAKKINKAEEILQSNINKLSKCMEDQVQMRSESNFPNFISIINKWSPFVSYEKSFNWFLANDSENCFLFFSLGYLKILIYKVNLLSKRG
jgi:ArsR family metal-binding transcriptional regulator